MTSPGVQITETSVGLRIPSVTSSVGAIVVAAEKGPLNTLTLVTSESEYIDFFGEPDDVNYKHWFTATEFLKSSNQLYVVRTEDTDTLVAGVTVGISGDILSADEIPLAWPTPKEATYFPMGYESIGVGGSTPAVSANPNKLEAWDGLNPVFGDGEEVYHVYGIGAGVYYNDVSFVTINALDYELLKDFQEEIVQAVTRAEQAEISEKYYTGTPPSTATPDLGDYLSNSLLKYDVINLDAGGNYSANTVALAQYLSFEFGPQIQYDDFGVALSELAQDEFAVIVFDTAGNAAESWIVSKEKDKKNTQGNRMFAPDIINGNSEFVTFFIDATETGAAGSRIISSGKVFLSGADELTGFNGNPLSAIDGEIQEQWVEHFTNKEVLEIDIILDPDYGTSTKQHIDDIASNIRKDCICLLSQPLDTMINLSTERALPNFVTSMKNYVQNTLLINSSYSAFYGQGFKVFDRFAEKDRWVPVSGYVGAVMASVDFNNAVWWAAAGLNRGIVSGVKKVAVNPTKPQRDVLYPVGINPIVRFLSDGIVIWGQKTLQTAPNGFDRIHIRRLFLHMERAIEKMSRFLIFEFNDDQTRSRFRSQVNAFLADIMVNRGIQDYLVVCDESNNTGEIRAAGKFVGDIYVRPADVIEFILLNFINSATGVELSEIVR